MTRWMLDDGPFGILSRFNQPSWNWKPSSFHLADAVVQSAANDKSGRRSSLLAQTADGLKVVESHAVTGSQAATTLWTHLRTASALSSRDLGEDESIALLVHELTDAVFVVLDRKAAMVALAELGHGRVASPFDYWDWLRTEGIIDGATFGDLCVRVVKEDSGFPGVPVRFR